MSEEIPAYYAWGAKYFLEAFILQNATFPGRERIGFKVSLTPEGHVNMSMGRLRDNGAYYNGMLLSPEFFVADLNSDGPVHTFKSTESQKERYDITRELALLEHEGFKVGPSGKDYSKQIDILLQTDKGLEVLVSAEKPSTFVTGKLTMKINSSN